MTAMDFRTVTAGPQFIEVIGLVYRAGRSAMLHGRPGVGSERSAAAAKDLGVDFLVLDLSVMEPPDLVGLPRIDEHGRTVQTWRPPSCHARGPVCCSSKS